jgi:hypothetical protein
MDFGRVDYSSWGSWFGFWRPPMDFLFREMSMIGLLLSFEMVFKKESTFI